MKKGKKCWRYEWRFVLIRQTQHLSILHFCKRPAHLTVIKQWLTLLAALKHNHVKSLCTCTWFEMCIKSMHGFIQCRVWVVSYHYVPTPYMTEYTILFVLSRSDSVTSLSFLFILKLEPTGYLQSLLVNTLISWASVLLLILQDQKRTTCIYSFMLKITFSPIDANYLWALTLLWLQIGQWGLSSNKIE